jgi:hypothetical protein
MPDLSAYQKDAEQLVKMTRAGLQEGAITALLRIIDRRGAEILGKDAEPIDG